MSLRQAFNKKRQSDESSLRQKPKRRDVEESKMEDDDDDGIEYEDPFEDEIDEGDLMLQQIRDHIDQGGEVPEDAEWEDVEGDGEEDEDAAGMQEKGKGELKKAVWRRGVDTLGEDEQLDYSSSAYTMFHRMTVEWPCLSFDVISDNLGMNRSKFPMTTYVLGGSQAEIPSDNQLFVMKWSQLHKTKHDDEDEEDDDDDSDEEDEDNLDVDPIAECKGIPHPGAVNRVRVMPQMGNIAASWSESGSVHLWDISKELRLLVEGGRDTDKTPHQPLFSFSGHPTEGFAMDWSAVSTGRLVTGDCQKHIYLWEPQEGGWNVDKVPFSGHADSVEDLQFSPTEANVFASCSVDQTVRIWDTRTKKNSMLQVHAHSADVNVLSWNKIVCYLLVSGSDDGSFKIWDLRNFRDDNSIAHFKFHSDSITSVHWHPTEESVVAVGGADNQLTIWDMSLEKDEEALELESDLELPPQLLFVHQGQQDLKEVRFHHQIPGVVISTAVDGFNIFKPINL
eukprot:GILI01012790.1.p1 GENE.GILI01012790.1~~GILI01012790.1.p1  ORF type:complete len:507 (-),score=175.73 GILI01012790.1:234-1754(-)